LKLPNDFKHHNIKARIHGEGGQGKKKYCRSMIVARSINMTKEFFDFVKETNIMKIGKW
jgi:hypothetical protein